MKSVFDLFDRIYEKEPKTTGGPKIGDCYWLPVSEIPEVPLILDVERADPTEHTVTKFAFRDIDPARHFRERDRLPIKALKLESTHELVVTRAKLRPCIVLFSAVADPSELTDQNPTTRRLTAQLGKRQYVLAPTYSVGSVTRPNAYVAEIVARTLALRYPHMFCVPDFEGALQPRSIVRLDKVFASGLGRGCRYSDYRLTEEASHLLLQQLAILCGAEPDETFTSVQTLLNEVDTKEAPASKT